MPGHDVLGLGVRAGGRDERTVGDRHRRGRRVVERGRHERRRRDRGRGQDDAVVEQLLDPFAQAELLNIRTTVRMSGLISWASSAASILPASSWSTRARPSALEPGAARANAAASSRSDSITSTPGTSEIMVPIGLGRLTTAVTWASYWVISSSMSRAGQRVDPAAPRKRRPSAGSCGCSAPWVSLVHAPHSPALHPPSQLESIQDASTISLVSSPRTSLRATASREVVPGAARAVGTA